MEISGRYYPSVLYIIINFDCLSNSNQIAYLLEHRGKGYHLNNGAGKACAGQSKVRGRPVCRLENVGSDPNLGAELLVGSID